MATHTIALPRLIGARSTFLAVSASSGLPADLAGAHVVVDGRRRRAALASVGDEIVRHLVFARGAAVLELLHCPAEIVRGAEATARDLQLSDRLRTTETSHP